MQVIIIVLANAVEALELHKTNDKNSLVETAKANGLIPFDYLKFLFEELPKEPDDIDYLLPWNYMPD